MKKYVSLVMFCFFVMPIFVFAHVVVKPSEVLMGSFQTFTIGVPVEKGISTVGLRLVVPGGLGHVMPNVKPGWTIEVIKSGENVSEIIWKGGSIPAGQRDDFLFSAQVPKEESKLVWKVYQSYADGTIVAWDVDPNDETLSDSSNSGPFSVTRVISSLSSPAENNKSDTLVFVALIVSLVSLIVSLKKRTQVQSL